MSDLIVTIATDFSAIPGARYRTDGKWSGQEFLEDVLRPKFEQARKSGRKLVINLDGAVGYATSFLEEAFGGLARAVGAGAVREVVSFVSTDEPDLELEIFRYVDATAR